MTINEITRLRPAGRHRCPWCGSSDGLSVRPGDGRGYVKCHSCDVATDGVRLLVEHYDYDYGSAKEALGVAQTFRPGSLAQEAAERRKLLREAQADQERRAKESFARALSETRGGRSPRVDVRRLLGLQEGDPWPDPTQPYPRRLCGLIPGTPGYHEENYA